MHRRNYDQSNSNVGGILLSIFILFMLIFGINSCSQDKWNNGICPNCNINYELRGVSRGLKYYECTGCHEEVTRFWLGE